MTPVEGVALVLCPVLACVAVAGLISLRAHERREKRRLNTDPIQWSDDRLYVKDEVEVDRILDTMYTQAVARIRDVGSGQ